ncbi:MAG TPA: hypothetical protein VFF39_08275 [Verrucomicrobiae bacterium]|nr:hypothetical protein [Verrucomicrobiae bacterium]
MSFNIYRFEILRELNRSEGIVVYEARDIGDPSLLRLYEWTPSPDEFDDAEDRFARAAAQMMSQFEGVEAFRLASHFYLAACEDQAERALRILRNYKLFAGNGAGAFETPKVSAQQKTAAASVSVHGGESAGSPSPALPKAGDVNSRSSDSSDFQDSLDHLQPRTPKSGMEPLRRFVEPLIPVLEFFGFAFVWGKLVVTVVKEIVELYPPAALDTTAENHRRKRRVEIWVRR